jgi:leucyl-tRNA synthetase
MPELKKLLHKTIHAVREDMMALSFNTAIARLMELNNSLTTLDSIPREVAVAMVKLLAPLAPHFAEEIWAKLGHSKTIAFEPFPVADAALLVEDLVEIPVMVQGKLRTRIQVPAKADAVEIEKIARECSKVIELLVGKKVMKVIVVPGRMINFVVS